MAKWIVTLGVVWTGFGLACSSQGEALDSADSTDSAEDTEAQEEPLLSYSNETCQEFKDGKNKAFEVGEDKRKFKLSLPDNPEGAPVVFIWHWLGGTGQQALNYLGYESVSGAEEAIVVAPDSDGYSLEWRFDQGASSNPDLLFFDDLLACLHQNFSVDLDRVYTTGMSAGGLWSSYLIIHRSDVLAAAAPLSGGALQMAYASPADSIPVMLVWGGESDTYSSFSFDEANDLFSELLRDDGHFVMECDHGQGHTWPNGIQAHTWSFFKDHPKGEVPSPYESGLPGSYPDYCSLP